MTAPSPTHGSRCSRASFQPSQPPACSVPCSGTVRRRARSGRRGRSRSAIRASSSSVTTSAARGLLAFLGHRLSENEVDTGPHFATYVRVARVREELRSRIFIDTLHTVHQPPAGRGLGTDTRQRCRVCVHRLLATARSPQPWNRPVVARGRARCRGTRSHGRRFSPPADGHVAARRSEDVPACLRARAYDAFAALPCTAR